MPAARLPRRSLAAPLLAAVAVLSLAVAGGRPGGPLLLLLQGPARPGPASAVTRPAGPAAGLHTLRTPPAAREAEVEETGSRATTGQAVSFVPGLSPPQPVVLAAGVLALGSLAVLGWVWGATGSTGWGRPQRESSEWALPLAPLQVTPVYKSYATPQAKSPTDKEAVAQETSTDVSQMKRAVPEILVCGMVDPDDFAAVMCRQKVPRRWAISEMTAPMPQERHTLPLEV